MEIARKFVGKQQIGRAAFTPCGVTCVPYVFKDCLEAALGAKHHFIFSPGWKPK